MLAVIILPLYAVVFYLHRATADDDDYRRLIVYGCEREAERNREKERKKEKDDEGIEREDEEEEKKKKKYSGSSSKRRKQCSTITITNRVGMLFTRIDSCTFVKDFLFSIVSHCRLYSSLTHT